MSTLESIMTREVYTTKGDTSVAEVAQAMVKGRFGSVIILDEPWIAGIFTERDVLRAAASGKDLNTTPISAWMTADPQTAPPDMTSDEAAAIMASNGFRHLPVVKGNDILGIVSLRDVLSTRIARSPR